MRVDSFVAGFTGGSTLYKSNGQFYKKCDTIFRKEKSSENAIVTVTEASKSWEDIACPNIRSIQ